MFFMYRIVLNCNIGQHSVLDCNIGQHSGVLDIASFVVPLVSWVKKKKHNSFLCIFFYVPNSSPFPTPYPNPSTPTTPSLPLSPPPPSLAFFHIQHALTRPFRPLIGSGGAAAAPTSPPTPPPHRALPRLAFQWVAISHACL